MRRTILHTGSSSGIGLESLKNLQLKCNIISLSRSIPKVEHENLTHYSVDFSNNCEKEMKQILDKHPEISDLVLCHGMGHFGKLENLSFAQMDEVMQVNFTSYAAILKTFLPHLKKKKYARIIVIGSISAILGGKEGSIYCASKFALRGFLDSLQDECRNTPISFTQIHPGVVRTPFFDTLHFGPGDKAHDAIDPKEVANAIDLSLFCTEGTVMSDIRLNAINKVIKKKS